jgi:hypothetical protein
MSRTEDRGQQTALEDRVRARVPLLFGFWNLSFPFLTNRTNQTNTTDQLIAICHFPSGLSTAALNNIRSGEPGQQPVLKW